MVSLRPAPPEECRRREVMLPKLPHVPGLGGSWAISSWLQFKREGSFGSAVYSKEELCAEMAAAYLCAEAGITAAVIENQAAYVAGWLKKLRDDRKLLIHAAAQAQHAADYIFGRSHIA